MEKFQSANERDRKTQVSLAFAAMQKIFPLNRDNRDAVKVWRKLGESVAKRWVQNQECNYSEKEMRRALLDTLAEPTACGIRP